MNETLKTNKKLILAEKLRDELLNIKLLFKANLADHTKQVMLLLDINAAAKLIEELGGVTRADDALVELAEKEKSLRDILDELADVTDKFFATFPEKKGE